MRLHLLSRLLLPCLSVSALLAQNPTGGARLLVANQHDHTVSFIDPVAGKEVAVTDVGGVTGHEVAVSPDGRTAYVPIYGNSGVGKPGTDGASMAIVDVASHKVVQTVEFGHPVRPHLPVYDKKNNLLYVTTELDEAMTVVDPRSLKIVGQIPTTQAQSHMLALSHDGSRGYTANVGPGTVSVLDMKAKKTLTVIPIAASTQRISISNDDKMVFTADQTKPQLAVIDTATNKIKAWVPLPGIGYGTALTRDGRWLLVAIETLHQVAVVDLKTLKVAKTLEVPGVPTEILARPDGERAYVSCGKQVAVIDLKRWKMETPIEAGSGADGLAWAE